MALRWGIVTAGKISHDFVNAFKSYPQKGEQLIAAVAARDGARAEAFAKLHNIDKFYDSYQDLANSSDIDIAYIGALNSDHYELAKLFLESGKHVLCEKPLCLNYKQAQSLINVARKENKFLMEAVWSRFSPAYVALQKEIEAGKLGDVRFVEVNFGLSSSTIERHSKKELGGSVTLDIGIYAFQLAQFIFKDEPVNVTAVGELSETGVDIVQTVILQYEGGRRAVINLHRRLRLWNKATVVGTAGRMTLEDPFHFPNLLIKVNGQKEEFHFHPSPLPYYYENSAGLVYQVIEVARCIKEGLTESPRMSHRESLILAKLEDAVRQQAGAYFACDDQEFL